MEYSNTDLFCAHGIISRLDLNSLVSKTLYLRTHDVIYAFIFVLVYTRKKYRHHPFEIE